MTPLKQDTVIDPVALGLLGPAGAVRTQGEARSEHETESSSTLAESIRQRQMGETSDVQTWRVCVPGSALEIRFNWPVERFISP